MEDRYLFKAKRLDDGGWVRGSYLYDYGRNIHYIFANEIVCPNCINDCRKEFSLQDYEVDPSTICQCTGLKDKNGKLIWENDIVRYTDMITGVDKIDCIKWNETHASFVRLHRSQMGLQYLNIDELIANGSDVVGNIFDNPGLLESEE